MPELDYEAYVEMAEPKLAAIAAEEAARHGLCAVAVEHRTGTVPLGEPSVLVAVSAPHRGEAFAGARAVIDRVKAEAPIWKVEVDRGGAHARRGHACRPCSAYARLRRMATELSLGEAARAIGVSADTLRRWDRAGKLRTVRDDAQPPARARGGGRAAERQAAPPAHRRRRCRRATASPASCAPSRSTA